MFSVSRCLLTIKELDEQKKPTIGDFDSVLFHCTVCETQRRACVGVTGVFTAYSGVSSWEVFFLMTKTIVEHFSNSKLIIILSIPLVKVNVLTRKII